MKSNFDYSLFTECHLQHAKKIEWSKFSQEKVPLPPPTSKTDFFSQKHSTTKSR